MQIPCRADPEDTNGPVIEGKECRRWPPNAATISDLAILSSGCESLGPNLPDPGHSLATTEEKQAKARGPLAPGPALSQS